MCDDGLMEPGTPITFRPPSALDVAAALAVALDADDFVAVGSLLDADVIYRVGDDEHRGPAAVVESYRSGSELARRLFDFVEFSHTIVGLVAERTARIDFADLLHVGVESLEHHSVQDVIVGVDGQVVLITDQPLDGERARVAAFMDRHGLTHE
jgi:hypothetical protein